MTFLVGIDEAGRGPIAGPVSVAAFCVQKKAQRRALSFFPHGKVRDSKKLSPKVREEIFAKLEIARKKGAVSFSVTLVSAVRIDARGISFAIREGLRFSLEKLKVSPRVCSVLLDGSLKAPEEFVSQKTIIKGDEKEAVIALASIVAKVSRDRLMVQLAKKHPGYGFEVHKGYGTRAHYNVLKSKGFSPIHRRSFLKSMGGKGVID